MTRTGRRLHLGAAALLGAASVFLAAGGPAALGQPRDVEPGPRGLDPPGEPIPEEEHVYRPPADTLVEQGRQLFVQGCSHCHALDARGVEGRAPSLRGVGARSAHFYLSTGRMPLEDVGEQPLRRQPSYPPEQIAALVAYIGSFGGPDVPEPRVERGSLPEGFRLYGLHCMGCHQVVAEGGAMPGALAPPLQDSTAVQIHEAVRLGPWVMPAFSETQLTHEQVDSIARYILLSQSPVDRGGWGIGHIGPVPEGMVTWLVGIAALLLVIRALGKRTTE